MDKVDDDAFWNRCRCINFPITFCENPTKTNEKLIDKYLDEKMKNWKMDFMHLLLEYYAKYKENGLNPTQKVLAFTSKYKADNDLIGTFATERIVRKTGSFIVWSNLKIKFAEWFSENGICIKDTPSERNLKKYLEEKIFDCEYKVHRVDNKLERGWHGFEIIQNEDE